MVAGNNGRGVCEEAGVLDQIDYYVLTFSKTMGGVGGAVLAKKEVTRYLNWYSKCPVPINEARVRLFVTSEHSVEQLDRCVSIFKKAAQEFKFELEK